MAFSTTAMLFLLASTGTSAAPITPPDFLKPLIPVKGTTLQDEIKCYSLPYGAIGFISHLLTYWAVVWLGFGKRPYAPWKDLSHDKTDLVLSLVQIVVTITIAGFTIAACQQRWQFVLIATWKLVMSVEAGIWGLRASLLAREKKADSRIWSKDDWTPYTLIGYAMGMVVGMVGLMSLVWEFRHDQQIVQISVTFLSITGFIILVCAIQLFCCCGFGSIMRSAKLAMAMAFTTILVCALYSDWILGELAGNLIGIPTGEQSIIYWIYFAAKRLIMFLS